MKDWINYIGFSKFCIRNDFLFVSSLLLISLWSFYMLQSWQQASLFSAHYHNQAHFYCWRMNLFCHGWSLNRAIINAVFTELCRKEIKCNTKFYYEIIRYEKYIYPLHISVYWYLHVIQSNWDNVIVSQYLLSTNYTF